MAVQCRACKHRATETSTGLKWLMSDLLAHVNDSFPVEIAIKLYSLLRWGKEGK